MGCGKDNVLCFMIRFFGSILACVLYFVGFGSTYWVDTGSSPILQHWGLFEYCYTPNDTDRDDKPTEDCSYTMPGEMSGED
jgi:hypothetical protein